MKSFRNFRIGTKVFILFGVSVVFIGGIVLVGLVNMLGMKNDSSRIYENTFMEAMWHVELNSDLENVRRALLTLLIEPDEERFPRHQQAIEDATRRIDGHIEQMLSDDSLSDKMRQADRELKVVWEAFKETRDSELLPAIYEGRLAHARRMAMGVQEERYQRFIGLSNAMVEYEQAEAVEAQLAMEERLRRTIQYYLIIIGAGLAVAVGSLVYVSKNIVGRIKSIERVLAVYEPGGEEVNIHVGGRDELGVLAESFNMMSRRLFEDRIMQDQSVQILEWNAEKMKKRAEELEEVNRALSKTQEELSEKNKEQEAYIREISETHLELQETRAQMVQSEKMASIGQLAAGVAHEINNPIGFISSNLNTLEDYTGDLIELLKLYADMDRALEGGGLDSGEAVKRISAFKEERDTEFAIADIEKLVEESREGVKRVVSIVRSLKDFSHADKGENEECDINRCLEDTVKVTWHEIKYKADVVKDFGELPSVVCHLQQINQVFLNIIVNAAQAIEEKGIITIKTFAENGDAVIKISDDGKGMPEATAKKIFDPFFTTKAVGKGTGLGLSIAYGIINEHKGALDVESEVGHGTTFTIRLPIRTEDALVADENGQAQTREGGAA